MDARQQTFRFAALTVPVYLLLLWPVASLFRVGGFEVLCAGIVLLAVAFALFARGWRKPLFGLYFCMLLFAAVVGIMELTLCACPGVLRGMAANYAFGRFHSHAGGIYQKDAHLAKRIRPNQTTPMYFNSFRWTHDANSARYRGELVTKADVVFLGDSMIYGHGVETWETVPFRYGVHSKQVSANLGIQGTGLIQSWIQLERLGVGLKPKLVVVCSHPNDIEDVNQYYDKREVEKFLASSPSDTTEPTARARFHPAPAWSPHGIWDEHLALPLYSAGAIRVLGQGFKMELSRLSGPVASTPAVDYKTKNKWKIETEAEQLNWKAHCHAVAKMKATCDRIGAKLVVIDLGFPEAFSQAMEAEATRLGASYSDAGRLALNQALAGDEDIYLPLDGHWSPHGCDVVAKELLHDLSAAAR